MTLDQVRRAQGGDHAAFETLMRVAYPRLFGSALRILRDRSAAEDATQDAIVRSWRELRGLRDPDRFDAWLHRLLVNACRDHGRRLRRRPTVAYDAIPDRGASTDDYARVADHDALERAFMTLPAEQRIALVLTHYGGYGAADVAAILNVPTGTVYSRLHYGLRGMRRALGEPDAARRASTELSR